jgi:PPK2 family polyphosphate:nucleotide phosphotransferase
MASNMSFYDRFRIRQGSAVDLSAIPTDDDGNLDQRETQEATKNLIERIVALQELMFAEGKHSLLIVLQAMDAAGKDSVIRNVFGPVNAQGLNVASFKAPSAIELAHDYLWRIHSATPRKGTVTIFNRSHYEDVLVVRVKNLVSENKWSKRYEHINQFEKLLEDEGTHIVKFYLHISPEYQKKQFIQRLEDPKKQWKFNPKDLDDRALWPEFQQAYEAALSKCSTEFAPWYVVPAEKKWFRNYLIASVIVDLLESLKMEYPKPDFDPSSIHFD